MKSKVEEVFVTPREQKSNFGFALWKAIPRVMPVSHQHNDVEVNFIDRGRILYVHGGQKVELVPGDMAVFWAARVHQVIETTSDVFFFGMSVPLAWFLSWNLPADFVRSILQNEMIRPTQDEYVSDFRARLNRWVQDLAEDSAVRRRVMLLEVEAWFHRLAIARKLESVGTAAGDGSGKHIAKGPIQKVEEMARYITEYYTEPISVKEVAAHVHLHPNYAVQLFRQTTGSTLVDFITKQRIAHAQLHLATTEALILDIALEAGFGSLSRFYAAFKREYGLSPNEYRAMVRMARPGAETSSAKRGTAP